MLTDITADIEKIVSPIVIDAGLEVVELTVDQRNATYMIELLIDRPQGGITLEECAVVNKKVAEIFDLTQSWANDYELVVASPGLDRLLKNEKDFRRMLTQRVRFLLTEKVDGKGEYSGHIKDVGSADVLVSLKSKEVRIPFNKIMKATLII
ncbi:MAG: hypothetical protein H6754_01390 [Candidatus Omnitrophica bacterium]|nr:hypothetical protein [Candidatus Omnitrophota bacterium]